MFFWEQAVLATQHSSNRSASSIQSVNFLLQVAFVCASPQRQSRRSNTIWIIQNGEINWFFRVSLRLHAVAYLTICRCFRWIGGGGATLAKRISRVELCNFSKSSTAKKFISLSRNCTFCVFSCFFSRCCAALLHFQLWKQSKHKACVAVYCIKLYFFEVNESRSRLHNTNSWIVNRRVEREPEILLMNGGSAL